MKTQLLIGAIIIVIIGIFTTTSYLGAANTGNAHEQSLHAKYESLQTTYGSMGQKVTEAIGVASMKKDAITDMLKTAMSSRYGEAGASAQVLMIKEALPNLDTAIYDKILVIIETGRNDFNNAQTRMIDEKRAYRSALGSAVQGFFLDKAGYPQINVGYPIGAPDDYQAITTEDAKQTFATGVESCDMVTKAQNGGKCPE